MSVEPRRLDFEEFARDLRSVFEAMDHDQQPLVVHHGGRTYRIEPQGPFEDIWATYDVARARAGLAASAGALAGVDREQLLADIRAQRGQDSVGRPTE
jgi:hypothetical protein